MNQVIIFSAPSGSGKTTIVSRLLSHFPELKFSISATSRAPRGEEQDGRDYFFLTPDEFASAVTSDKFIEWQEVYQGTCYGTLRSEVQRIWDDGGVVVFDVDVVGGMNLKRIFGASALSVFIMPPSVEVLAERLARRGTDSAQAIERRVAKASEELTYAPRFDTIIINDDLNQALSGAIDVVSAFID